MLEQYTESVQFIKGVGPRTASVLAKLGIESARDLLLHLPREYQDRSQLSSLDNSDGVRPITVRLSVLAHRWQPIRGRGRLLKIIVSDGKNEGALVCFNRNYLADSLAVGSEVIVSAVFAYKYGSWQASAFDYEFYEAGESLSTGRIVPLYPLTAGVSQKLIRKSVAAVLEKSGVFSESLPQYIIDKRGLLSFDAALRNLHYPESFELLEQARKRIAYQEFFIFQLALLYRRGGYIYHKKNHHYQALELLPALQEQFGFALTAGQKSAVQEIYADMLSEYPMHRLLLGDVGCGKTAVAAAALLLALKGGVQAAVAAPTTILAQQLFEKLERYLVPFDINLAFLSGKTPKGERAEIVEKLASGYIQLLVGTHALFSDDISFASLGLVVIDEQHRFGVRHRQRLRAKGERADYLAMSATPIPRSLALSLYGDCTMSRIEGLPIGRQPVKTFWLRGKHAEAERCLQEQLRAGRSGYFVFPLVEETEKSDLKDAVSAYEKLQKKYGSFGVGLLHGRMDESEKHAVMARFQSGEIQLLVSTTVIEVGVDNKNATIMVIEGANRFGLSQLHQLRGRVGRGDAQSYCFLNTPASCGEECVARMGIMVSCNDGFRIAEEDLAIRGPGDFFGVNQSGEPLFYLADIVLQSSLLERARKDALFIIQKDPQLDSEYNVLLKEQCLRLRDAGGIE